MTDTASLAWPARLGLSPASPVLLWASTLFTCQVKVTSRQGQGLNEVTKRAGSCCCWYSHACFVSTFRRTKQSKMFAVGLFPLPVPSFVSTPPRPSPPPKKKKKKKEILISYNNKEGRKACHVL